MITVSRTMCLSAVLVALSLAVAAGQDQTSKPASKDQKAASQAAILRGRVTDLAGAPLAGARVRVVIPAADMRFVDASTPDRRLETQSDAQGDYRIELTGIAKRTKVSIDAMKPGYERLVGTLMSGGDARSLDVEPGAVAETFPLRLKPALHFAGVVVDERGKPIPGVQISANAAFDRGSGGIERTATGSDGSFELFNYPLKPFAPRGGPSRGIVFFSHPDHIDLRIEDIYTIAVKEREALRVVLETGQKLAGTVVDIAGKPVPNATVKAVLKDGTHGKGTTTDAAGKFTLRGLSKGLTALSARSLEIKQKTLAPIAVRGDRDDLVLRLRAISLPADLKPRGVLGMQLADVTPELKSAYDLFQPRGALILDPGQDSDRLEIGPMAEGYVFWIVGEKRIGGVREFVDQILAETAGQDAAVFSVRVVYSFSTAEVSGNNTQFLKLTKADRGQLQILSDQLAAEGR